MKTFSFLFAVVALAAITGCGGSKVSLDAVDAPLRTMAQRHDTYVKADEKLAPVEKDIALRTSELVIKTLDTAQKKDVKKAESAE